jgi:cysteine desulfurase
MAASLASRDLKKFNDKALHLRDILEEGISRIYPNAMINGKSANRVPNTTSVTFPGIESEALLLMLDKDGICASSGSACLADAEEPSHVIKAMHPDTTQARETVRFSTGLSNTEDEIRETLSSLERSVKRLSK